MKALYVKGKFQFQIRDITLRDIEPDEVLLKVSACGFCGSEIFICQDAKEWQPIGHELSGRVEKVGPMVKNVKVGDQVVVESGSYDRFSDLSRNGHYDWDNSGRHFFNRDAEAAGMGMAEYVIAPAETCVPYEGMPLAAACLIEPMGVAYDMIKVADIQLDDDVMIVGTGAIGLMALRLAKLRGAGHIYAVNRSGRDYRDEIALKWGADAVIHNDVEDINAYPYPNGGVDKILFTTPPRIMPDFLDVLNISGNMTFIGKEADEGPGVYATFDMNKIHLKKLQIRSSFAAPALFFPACIKLYKEGKIDLDALYTHDLHLDTFEKDFWNFMNDRAKGIKAILFND